MSFILGVVLFVGVVGMLDSRLPWPNPRGRYDRDRRTLRVCGRGEVARAPGPALVADAAPHPGYGEGIIDADYTHSLLGALVIAVTFGLAAAWFWGGRNGAVLAGAVLSRTGCWTCWSIAPTCLFCPAMRATFRDSASACGAFP